MSEEKIYKAISAIMAGVTAIGKNSQNQMQHYNFRGIDDVYNELHKLLAKHEVFTVSDILSERHEDRVSSKGSHLIYRVFTIKYTFYASDGSNVSSVVIGEGMDSGDKASNKAMAVAHKYALLQMFAVPTDEPKDPENDSPEVGAPKTEEPDPPAPVDVTLVDDLIEEIRAIMSANAYTADERARTEATMAEILKTQPDVLQQLSAIKRRRMDVLTERVAEHRAAEKEPPTKDTEDIPFGDENGSTAPPEAAVKKEDEVDRQRA